MRPSGKITSVWPPFTALTRSRGAERLGRIDRVGVDELQERLRPPGRGDAGVDGEGGVARQDRMQDRAVEQADVVGRDDGAGRRRRQVLQAPSPRGRKKVLKMKRGDIVDAVAAPGPQHQRRSPRGWRRRGRRTARRRLTPMPCSARPATRLAAVMKAALTARCTAAITRARRSIGAQACTAANDGTMNRPPADDRPNRAKPACAGRSRRGDELRRRRSCVGGRGRADATAQARSRQNTPIRKAPIGTSARFGRSLLACAATAEPTAMPIVKISSAERHDAFGAADAGLDERRQQRQRDRADQPEPRHDLAADPQALVGLEVARAAQVEVHGLR